MRPLSYLILGIVGTITYQNITENQPQFAREMRKMMKQNTKTFRKIREIF